MKRLPRRFRYGLVAGALGLSTALVWACQAVLVSPWWWRALRVFGAYRILLLELAERLHAVAATALTAAVFVVPLALVLRTFARRRARLGGGDLPVAVGRWLERHRALRALLVGAPSLVVVAAAMLSGGRWMPGEMWQAYLAGAIASVFGASASALLVRGFLRRFTAPVLGVEDRTDVAIAAEDMHFAAVAITPETRAMAAAFSLAVVGAVFLSIDLPTSVSLTMTLVPFAAAFALAFAFRGASRIAVGIDGVRAYGTSRTRFFAFRDLDGAELTGAGDVVLRSGEKAVLRLQLHGDDATRAAAIVARIKEGIERACEARLGSAHRFAEAASAKDLARAARDGGDYRAPGATRDELWQVVESPASDAASREAAARALAAGATKVEGDRLRIACEKCASPDARAALLRIVTARDATEDHDVEDEAAPPAAASRRVATS